MKIGIVLHPYGEDKPAGLGRAIFEITRSLIEQDKKNEYLVILRRRPKILPGFPGNNWKIKIADHKYFWLDRALFGENLDVCIFNTPIISFFIRPKKSVVIAYDFAYDDFGPNYLLKLYHRFSLKTADLMISISVATKKKIIKLFNIPADKIKVVYLGYYDISRKMADPVDNLPSKYFLFVGVIKKRKNVFGVVKAFREFKNIVKSDHKLIIAGWGSGEYFERIKDYIGKNNLSQDVFVREDIRGDKLSEVYRKAEMVLYPSFIEGFGFPVLEAMSCGTPVITSNISSLPEVAGDAAILVDPNNPSEIVQAMKNVSENQTLRAELIKKGYEQIKKFSWQKTAKEYLDILHGLK